MTTLCPKWEVYFSLEGNYHVSPIDDTRPHEFNMKCWCRPDTDDDIIVHHSADSREFFEEGGKIQ